MNFDYKLQLIEAALDKQFPNLSCSQTPGLPLIDFNVIISEYRNGSLIIYSDFRKSNEFLNLTPFKNVYINVNAITALPYWIALITSIWGLFHSNYFLLLSFLAVFFGMFLTTPFIVRKLSIPIFLIGSLACYYFVVSRSMLAILGLFFVASWFSVVTARKYLHRKITELVLSSERILCLLFKQNVIGFLWNGKSYRFFDEHF